MDLFELLAYYNNSDVPPAEEVEWHAVRNFAESPLSPPLWKSVSAVCACAILKRE